MEDTIQIENECAYTDLCKRHNPIEACEMIATLAYWNAVTAKDSGRPEDAEIWMAQVTYWREKSDALSNL